MAPTPSEHRDKWAQIPWLETKASRVRVAPGDPLRRVDEKVSAVLRRTMLEPESLPSPQRIMVQRYRILSPAQEDGMVMALLDELGGSVGPLAEAGLPAQGALLAYPVRDFAARGVFIDAASRRLTALQVALEATDARFVSCEGVRLERMRELVVEELEAADPDVVAVGASAGAAATWSLLRTSERLACIAYNPLLGSDPVTLLVDAPLADGGRAHTLAGSSLAAVAAAGAQRGYRLVAVEPDGCTAFLVRDDAGDRLPAFDLATAYAISEGRIAQDLAQRNLEEADQLGLRRIDADPPA